LSRWLGLSESASSTTAVVPPHLEEFLNLAISHLGDAHHKVVNEAMNLILICCKTKNTLVTSHLGVLLPAIFYRLADRKPGPRTQANEILDTLRVVYDPVILLSSLSPRISDMPERMRVAVFQFLITIAPQCESFFNNPQSSSAFLSRVAILLGSTGVSKPSSSLMISGKRLIEMLYKTSSQVNS
jgi:hypothetical protein